MFETTVGALQAEGVELDSAELAMRPTTRTPVEEGQVGSLMRLIDELEENDDVQGVHANFDVDAEVLERWNVVNRVLPDEELLEKGMKFAHRLAAGPTKAHAATKRIIRAYLEDGVDRADRETPKVAASLFETEDLQNAVRSFLEEGPGNATFEGR